MPSPLGEKIRARRMELDMSLDQLAKLTESSKGYLWELENRDKPNPSVDKLTRLAEALRITAEFLMDASAGSPDESVKDKAFFRNYQNLDADSKAKVRKLVQAWKDED